MKLKRGDIVLADLGQSMTRGHVQNGIRPGVIVSADEYNRKLKTLSICVMTTKRMEGDEYQNHIKITPSDVKGYLREPSMILMESPVLIDRHSILAKTGSILNNVELMERLDQELRRFYGLDDMEVSEA